MGFIEDHHIGFGDQFAKTALFDHHIGEEQVMVDHHDVGVHRLFTRLHHETLLILRAVAAKAVIVGAGDQRPRLRILGDADAGADVAINRLVRPAAQQNDVAQGIHR